MTSETKHRIDPDANFSFGVRELRQAKSTNAFSLKVAPQKAANDKVGCDPYNTSGSFDRKKNWTRVGKR
jgi:hypothetical protein